MDFEDDFAKDFADDDGEDAAATSAERPGEGEEELVDEEAAAMRGSPAPKEDGDSDGESSLSSNESVVRAMVNEEAVRAQQPLLRKSARYADFMKSLSLAVRPEAAGHTQVGNDALARHRAQKLIVEANETILNINHEMSLLHQIAAKLYKPGFPELESLVPDPADFARVVLAYGRTDEADLQCLPSAQRMVVKVSKATSKVAAIPPDDLTRVLDLCKEVCALDADKATIVAALEVLMRAHAPNTFELVGSRTAALLVGIAGGLEDLARMPSNDIQVMGRTKAQRASTGIVAAVGGALAKHGGVLAHCPLIVSAPRPLRRRVLRVAAGRLALAARMDFARRDPSGGAGRAWREEIEKKIVSWQDAGPGKTKKALPLPDQQKAKRRGGRRARRQKELMGLTDLRILANREKFGEGEDEYSASAMGKTLGMVGKSGVGSLGKARAVQVKDTQRLGQQVAKKLRGINASGAGVAVSGLTSIAFTPIQGMELAQPKAAPSMPPPPPKGSMEPPGQIRKKV